MKSNSEIHQDRLKSNKRYSAYIPNFLAIPFNDKLEKEGKKFTDWLKEQMEKYLKKN